jgi:bifunctional non-homologous end joining protein LigD
LVQKKGAAIHGINRKGLLVGLPSPIVQSAHTIPYDFVIDGECVGDDLHVFDILELSGRDLRPEPYGSRLVELINLLASGLASHLPMLETAFGIKRKQAMFQELKVATAEGVVFKKFDAPYTPGRPNSGGSQLKHKFYATVSAVVTKINQQRSVEIGLIYEDGWQTAGNVTIPTNCNIPARGSVVEIRYLYAFKQSGVLYQPTYLGPRQDIQPLECLASQLKFKAEGDGE